jgi:hypothetical protein
MMIKLPRLTSGVAFGFAVTGSIFSFQSSWIPCCLWPENEALGDREDKYGPSIYRVDLGAG